MLTCVRHEDEPEGTAEPHELGNAGNFIRFSELQSSKGRIIDLENVYTRYCKPKLKHCRCKKLLGSLLDLRPDTIRINGNFFAEPPIAGCKCYLGAAVKKGFKFLYMNGDTEECRGKRDLMAEPYKTLCKYIVEHNCLGLAEITKTDPDDD